MAILTSLKSFAHLLNMLEMAFNDPEKSKLTLFYNISIERGFFNKMKTQNHECENNLQFSNEKDPNNTENNSEKTYAEIITSLYSLKNERLCHVCKNLFLTMDTIEKTMLWLIY
ncbi:MAG: hypothetical protein HWD59_12205 [Coxiellaceae bacterium]|nr:MAG: hypothetical protein HWD59_12205 [Coxiellaceae bacterium]